MGRARILPHCPQRSAVFFQYAADFDGKSTTTPDNPIGYRNATETGDGVVPVHSVMRAWHVWADEMAAVGAVMHAVLLLEPQPTRGEPCQRGMPAGVCSWVFSCWSKVTPDKAMPRAMISVRQTKPGKSSCHLAALPASLTPHAVWLRHTQAWHSLASFRRAPSTTSS
jgi:hypothetical protein